MKKIILIIISLIGLNATTIIGQGYGDNEKESLKDALSDLSNRISVNVKSDLKTFTNTVNKKYKKSISQIVHLSSSLPIKGAEFKTINSARLTKTTAILNSSKALYIYKKEIAKLKRNISSSFKELKKSKNSDIKYKILTQILEDIESFEKHKIVAILLGAKNLPSLNVNKNDIKIKLQKLESKITNLKIISKILNKNIKQYKGIYISALRIQGSSEITQFARVVKKIISENLDVVSKPVNAKYFLRGSYEVLQNSIFIHYSLSDTYNKTLKSINLLLDKKAYKNLKYKSLTKSFDESINSGFIKSSKLFTQIGFKGFNRVDGIDLSEGDQVDIIVKSNKSVCYFLIGHVLKDKEKFSYLLPMNEDSFINYITGNDINRNITIASDVEISKPLGSEVLHIFSQSVSKKNKCSLKVPHCKDNDDGLCVISGKPNEVASKTRALNMSKKRFKRELHDNTVSWTSFK